MFLFFKQQTAYDMRMSDWSSDVCSSDLLAGSAMLLFEERSRSLKAGINLAASLALVATMIPFLHMAGSDGPQSVYLLGNWPAPFGIVLVLDNQIGRVSGRESVYQYV